jgi:radical SAM protein with 4Fe4S-binding SPASM domain
MVHVKLSRHSFVRRYEDIGLILNQRNRSDLVFDQVGAVFLEHLPRTPRPVEKLAAELASQFVGTTPEEIGRDFQAFVSDLEKQRFVLTGNDPSELDARDAAFVPTKRLPGPPRSTDGGLNVQSSDLLLTRHFVKHPRLFSLQIEASGRCNERCLHCYFPWDAMKTHPMLDTALLLDVLDQLVPLGTMEATFTGGEPLLNRDLPLLMERARCNDLSISLLTNAVLFTSETIPMLQAFNVGLVQISVYSTTEAVHDKITGVVGSCRKSMAAVEQLADAGIPVEVGCPVMKENLETFGDVLLWGQRLGIKVDPNLIIMAKKNLDRANLVHRLTIEECEKAMQTIFRYDTRYHSVLLGSGSQGRPKDPELPLCAIGGYMMCLGANGDYYPCPGFALPLGSALTQSVREVWETSPKIRELRAIRSKSYPGCLSCESWDYCPLCASRHYSETGSLLTLSEHVCDVTHLNRRMAIEWKAKQPQPESVCAHE